MARARVQVEPEDASEVRDPLERRGIEGDLAVEGMEHDPSRRTPRVMSCWLLGDRSGCLYRRRGAVVGFSFVGHAGVGPVAALEGTDLPEILGHVETVAAEMGIDELDVQVPSINEIATRHLLARGFRFDPWANYLMSDRAFGEFDRYICFGPSVFLQRHSFTREPSTGWLASYSLVVLRLPDQQAEQAHPHEATRHTVAESWCMPQGHRSMCSSNR